MAVSTQNVFGAISLIVWSVTIIVTLEYVLLVMRVDNDGPVMIVWFLAIDACGVLGIVQHPVILKALSPTYAVGFLIGHFPVEPLHDPRILRAFAHPVRSRILDELGAIGPMRAADLARTLNIPANQASFHLRQLAKYGLVVEAPEQARDGRDRVWQAAHEAGFNISISELAKAPGGKAAVTVFQRAWSAAAHDAVDRAEIMQSQPDALVMVSDAALRLTRSDAEAFVGELTELVERWRIRGRSAKGTDQPAAKTYQLLQILQQARDV